MREAVLQLAPACDYLLIDAMRLDCDLPQQAIIHGDALSASIAAASILAKVERDRMISEWDPVFPIYGLRSNKGYSTPRHLAACASTARRRCIVNLLRQCGTRPFRKRCWNSCCRIPKPPPLPKRSSPPIKLLRFNSCPTSV